MTKDEFITERTRIISEMLDNPDKYGIYPTTKCFNALDELFDKINLSNKTKLDVPSDEEMMKTIWEETDVSLSLKDKEENTVAYAMYLEIIRWAIWMKEEIIKRNK